MRVDGRQIAEDILEDVKKKVAGRDLMLSVVIVGNNPATESFVRIKKKKAKEVGILLNEIRFDNKATTEDLVKAIEIESKKEHAIIVQLPLPAHIDREKVLNTIPKELDVDVLRGKSKDAKILSPVVGAIKEILDRNAIDPKGKRVVVIGLGKLVGEPAVLWFKHDAGADVIAVDIHTKNIETYIKEADIILSGAGVPNLVTKDMVKEGVVLLDAGTSEDAGVLQGDISSGCETKASLYTPVPGGIGPVTVAVLLRNVIASAK